MGWRTSSTPTWYQFAAWAACGACSVLILVGAFTVGPLGAVPTALFAVLAVRLGGANVSAVGALVGVGAWCAVVGWLNRQGPGTVCSTSASGHFCEEQWAPWPFWVASALFIVVPVIVVGRRRRQMGRTGPPDGGPGGGLREPRQPIPS